MYAMCSKIEGMARVLASYLYTFGSKPVELSTEITIVSMCFGVVLLYVWLAARSKIIAKRVFWHVFWHCIYIRLARNPFKNQRKTCVLARVLAI